MQDNSMISISNCPVCGHFPTQLIETKTGNIIHWHMDLDVERKHRAIGEGEVVTDATAGGDHPAWFDKWFPQLEQRLEEIHPGITEDTLVKTILTCMPTAFKDHKRRAETLAALIRETGYGNCPDEDNCADPVCARIRAELRKS